MSTTIYPKRPWRPSSLNRIQVGVDTATEFCGFVIWTNEGLPEGDWRVLIPAQQPVTTATRERIKKAFEDLYDAYPLGYHPQTAVAVGGEEFVYDIDEPTAFTKPVEGDPFYLDSSLDVGGTWVSK